MNRTIALCSMVWMVACGNPNPSGSGVRPPSVRGTEQGTQQEMLERLDRNIADLKERLQGMQERRDRLKGPEDCTLERAAREQPFAQARIKEVETLNRRLQAEHVHRTEHLDAVDTASVAWAGPEGIPPPQFVVSLGIVEDRVVPEAGENGACGVRTERSVRTVGDERFRSWGALIALNAWAFHEVVAPSEYPVNSYYDQLSFTEFGPFDLADDLKRGTLLRVLESEEALALLDAAGATEFAATLVAPMDLDAARTWLRDYWSASHADFVALQQKVEADDAYLHREAKKREGVFLRRWMSRGGGAAGDDLVRIYHGLLAKLAGAFKMPEAEAWRADALAGLRRATTLAHAAEFAERLTASK